MLMQLRNVQIQKSSVPEESPDSLASRVAANYNGSEPHEATCISKEGIQVLGGWGQGGVILILGIEDMITVEVSAGSGLIPQFTPEKSGSLVTWSGDGSEERKQDGTHFHKMPVLSEPQTLPYLFDVLRTNQIVAAHDLKSCAGITDFSSSDLRHQKRMRVPKTGTEKHLQRETDLRTVISYVKMCV